MTDASETVRGAILGRIQRANQSRDDLRAMDYDGITREYQRSTNMSRAEIIRTFVERLQEYDARVRPTTKEKIRNVLAEAIAKCGGKPTLVVNGFPGEWLSNGHNWMAEGAAGVEAMDTADGTVAKCEVAIAHTGTIILRGSRRATLLPDRLVCVVREDQVVETVPEAMARLEPFAKEALTFISGPSATADIEMTRIRGVHGPRFLDVILLEY